MSEPAFFEHAHRGQDLVSTRRLVERLGRPDIAVVDASVSKRLENDDIWLSDRAAFEAGHIPGARFADLVSDFSDPEERFAFTRPTASRLASAAGAIGLTNTRRSSFTTTARAYGPRDSGGCSRPSVTTTFPFWMAV
jgi:3-mercaptopyruvate sulfurtransferase SseA